MQASGHPFVPLDNIEILGNLWVAKQLLLVHGGHFSSAQLMDIKAIKRADLKITMSALSQLSSGANLKFHKQFESLINAITRGFLMTKNLRVAYQKVFVQILKNGMKSIFSIHDGNKQYEELESIFCAHDGDEQREAPQYDDIWIQRRFLVFIRLLSANRYWVGVMCSKSHIPHSCYINNQDVAGFYDQCERICEGRSRLFLENCKMPIRDMILSIKADYDHLLAIERGQISVVYEVARLQIVKECDSILSNFTRYCYHRIQFLAFANTAKSAGVRKNGGICRFFKSSVERPDFLRKISSMLELEY
jgi:hypothetical protein